MSNFVSKIFSGSSEIIGSGTIITFDSEPIKFEFGSAQQNLKLQLAFSEDDSGKMHLEANAPEENEIKLTLYNFRNVLGSGLTTPVPIGVWDNKRLYFSFRVYGFDNSDQLTLHYSFYLKNE